MLNKIRGSKADYPRTFYERCALSKRSLDNDKLFLTGVVLGSTLTNTGTTDLHIYAGRTTAGNPNIVARGANFGVLKGLQQPDHQQSIGA